jgi:GAF domain-containing protein
MAKLGFRSNIIAPLISKGRAIGTLSLRSHKVDAFGPAEQTILERLAHQIAPAIENARLYQQLQAHTKEMAVVDEVARIITSALEIDQVCEEFTREMRKLVDFERAAISMVNREADTFTVQYVFGDPRSGHPVGSVMPLAGNLTGELVKFGQTIVHDDIATVQGYPNDQDHLDLGLRSCIALPLVSKGRVISLILRSRRVGDYGIREQAILERLTRQIAPAIENAQLYKTASNEKERATTTLAQFKAVLSGVDTGILLVGSNQDVLWANHRFGEFFG